MQSAEDMDTLALSTVKEHAYFSNPKFASILLAEENAARRRTEEDNQPKLTYSQIVDRAIFTYDLLKDSSTD